MIFVCFAALLFSIVEEDLSLDGAKVAALGGGSLTTWAEFLLDVLKLGWEDRARR